MGLLDVLNGMQNGPGGSKDSTPAAPSSGGMSPMTMAVLALLAYKAVKHVTAGSGTATAPATPTSLPKTTPAGLPDTTTASANGGGLGGLLGGLLAGGAAGGVLSGGLGDLLKQLQDAGHGDTANSWVDTGPNKHIAPKDLESALGTDQINTLTSQTGLSRNELLEGLSQQLPQIINQLTPHGRVPSEHEANSWL
ncbi:MAG TPA: YidB family protein [Afipia sp.]